MRRKIIKLLLGLITILLVFIGWVQDREAQASEPIKWRMHTAWPGSSIMIPYYEVPFANLVKERSKGRLIIEWMPLNAMLSPDDIFSGVSKDVVQGGCSVGAYHSRIVPEAYVGFGLPNNFSDYNSFYDFYYNYKNKAFQKLIDQSYMAKGCHLLGGVGYSETIHTNFRLTKIDDLKGKKLRAVGGAGHHLKALGGSPVNLTASETYTAIQRGTVDGALLPLQGVVTWKLLEVVKYTLVPGIRIGFVEIFCNLDAFKKLPADLQKIVEEAAVEAAHKTYRLEYEKNEESALQEARRAGVEIITLPSEERAKMSRYVQPIWDEAAAKSKSCAEMVGLLRDYIKEKNIR